MSPRAQIPEFDFAWIEGKRLIHSSLPLSQNVESLRALGVTSIINCVETTPPQGPLPDYGEGPGATGRRTEVVSALAAAGIEEVELDVTRDAGFLESEHLSRAWEHYTSRRGAGVVLVHCRLGQDRSATVLAAILAKRDALTGAEAVELTRELSHLADPQPGAAEVIDRWLEACP
jgi:vacuolar-type H+-ATPase subunit F/Vma7